MTNLKTKIIEFLRSKKRIREEKIHLPKIENQKCDSSNLLSASQVSLQKIFQSPTISDNWANASTEIAPFKLPESTGGVNPGDRRAIFYLIQHFKPNTVLEVGTHIGASTIHITEALQLALSSSFDFTTVDISDVNNEGRKPWLNYGSAQSPAAMLQQIKEGSKVKFIVSPSLQFMKQTDQKYDFIFLDGDHAAATVYQEIPAACKILKKDGVILLHDFFPDMKPLWSNGAVHPGPYLAVERLKKEGASLRVLPLGNLPWPTKLNSNTTSLALLLRNE